MIGTSGDESRKRIEDKPETTNDEGTWNIKKKMAL
jgi:hypothetical protein